MKRQCGLLFRHDWAKSCFERTQRTTRPELEWDSSAVLCPPWVRNGSTTDSRLMSWMYHNHVRNNDHKGQNLRMKLINHFTTTHRRVQTGAGLTASNAITHRIAKAKLWLGYRWAVWISDFMSSIWVLATKKLNENRPLSTVSGRKWILCRTRNVSL
jgi:hypothetical protein